MISFTYLLKTNVSDAFFVERKSDVDFVDWINKLGRSVFSAQYSIELTGIEGLTGMTIQAEEFTSDHELSVVVSLITDSNDPAEFIYNEELMRYIETDAMTAFIDLFNSASDIIFPMHEDSFNDIEFRDDEFFARVYLSSGRSRYESLPIATVTLAAVYDFDPQF